MSTDGGELVQRDMVQLPSGTVGVLTMNRGPLRNPLDFATVKALNVAVDDVLRVPEARAVVLTGAPPAFSAGGDLRGYLDLYQDKAEFRRFLEAIAKLCDKLENGRLLSVAAINGACVAGGLEMALSCDLMVAGRSARIGDGHLKYFQLPGGGGSQRLPRAVGSVVAKRLFYTHELLPADEALRVGLVAAVFDDASLLDDVLAMVAGAITAPEETVSTMKRLLSVSYNQPLDVGIRREIDDVVEYATDLDGAAYAGLLRFLERSSSNGTAKAVAGR